MWPALARGTESSRWYQQVRIINSCMILIEVKIPPSHSFLFNWLCWMMLLIPLSLAYLDLLPAPLSSQAFMITALAALDLQLKRGRPRDFSTSVIAWDGFSCWFYFSGDCWQFHHCDWNPLAYCFSQLLLCVSKHSSLTQELLYFTGSRGIEIALWDNRDKCLQWIIFTVSGDVP